MLETIIIMAIIFGAIELFDMAANSKPVRKNDAMLHGTDDN